MDDYEDNEVGAAARYEGKTVRVTGKVRSIDKGPLGGSRSPSRQVCSWEVTCSVRSLGLKTDSIANLSPGDRVTIVGRVTGRVLNSGRDVNARDCRVE